MSGLLVALLATAAGALPAAPPPRLGEEVRIDRPTRGPVVGLVAPVTVASRVAGDVVVLGGDATVTEAGVVEGDLVVVAGGARVAGTVTGRVVDASSRGVLAPLVGDPRRHTLSAWGAHLVHAGAWLAAVGAIALVVPQLGRRGCGVLMRQPWRAAGAGVLALVVWVAVLGIGLLLGVSPAGAGVVVGATALLMVAKVLGVAVVAFWLGGRLAPLFPAALRGEAPRAGVGLILVLAVGLLPAVGEAVWLGTNALGIGAVVLLLVSEGLPRVARVLSLGAPRV